MSSLWQTLSRCCVLIEKKVRDKRFLSEGDGLGQTTLLKKAAAGSNLCDCMNIVFDENVSEHQLLPVKRVADGKALPKNPRREEKSAMNVESLLKPEQVVVYGREPGKNANVKKTAAKKGNRKTPSSNI